MCASMHTYTVMPYIQNNTVPLSTRTQHAFTLKYTYEYAHIYVVCTLSFHTYDWDL